jgi:hypothetical protein
MVDVPALSPRSRSALAIAALGVGGLLLVGCSGGSSAASSPAHASRSSTGTSPSSPTPTIEPGTTPPGTKLKLGQPAVVRYTANAAHDSLMKLTVDKLRQGSLKDLHDFQLSDAAKRSNVYYAWARVKNTGDGDLGGQPLQLYGKVSHNLVVPPVIMGATFKKCPYHPLPKKFTAGDSTSVCVLLLAPHHGNIKAVQWRPANDAAPVTWTARH